MSSTEFLSIFFEINVKELFFFTRTQLNISLIKFIFYQIAYYNLLKILVLIFWFKDGK